MDPLGNPILDKKKDGNFVDREGKRVNQKGYLVDSKGNVLNKYGKVAFEKKLLDNEADIPKVFRTGLLKSDTASSLSRLMSEIGKNQPSEFDQEEERIKHELANNVLNKKRETRVTLRSRQIWRTHQQTTTCRIRGTTPTWKASKQWTSKRWTKAPITAVSTRMLWEWA